MSAYIRSCLSQGVPAVVVRHGDDDAGAIFISINRLDGTVQLYGPAPAGCEGTELERRWVRCLGLAPVAACEAERYLKREWDTDPDLWIIEIEDRRGRHFLGDAATSV